MIRVSHNAVRIDTQELRAVIVNGVVEVWEPKTPKIAKADLAKARERMAVCAGCNNAGAVTTTRKGWPVYAVQCKLAGRCAKVSLVNGRCAAGKW